MAHDGLLVTDHVELKVANDHWGAKKRGVWDATLEAPGDEQWANAVTETMVAIVLFVFVSTLVPSTGGGLTYGSTEPILK